MKFEIKSRWSGSVLFSLETGSLKLCIEAAVKSGADLRDADLRGADLRGAVLRGADLTGADLRGAVLRGAVLRGAVLTDADLRDADLTGADLRGAVLRGAVLRGAVLTDADLRDAVLRDAVLPYAPKIENLDAKILERIANGGTLNMDAYHSCETTHCRAGWAIVEAGEAGKVLESAYGAYMAGFLIYRASTGKVPDFFASNEDAMADLQKAAGK